jgi:hypothetical protein
MRQNPSVPYSQKHVGPTFNTGDSTEMFPMRRGAQLTKIQIIGFPFVLEFDQRRHKIRQWRHLNRLLKARAPALAELAGAKQSLDQSMDGQTHLLQDSDDCVSECGEYENSLSASMTQEEAVFWSSFDPSLPWTSNNDPPTLFKEGRGGR